MKDEMFYAQQYSKMIKCPTVTYSGRESFADLRNAMKENCPLVFTKCEIEILPEDVLIIKWKGKSSDRPLVLMGHQDVVPALGDDWEHPPFSGDIDDGRVWGRGACDDKCQVYCTMRAVEELLEDDFVPEQDIYLSYSDSEERFGPGVHNAKKWYIDHGVKPNMVIDEGAMIDRIMPKIMSKRYATVGVLEKGYLDVKFIARSKGGHSSIPEKGNPIYRLSKLVNYCNSHTLFKKQIPPVAEEMVKSAVKGLNLPFRTLLKPAERYIPQILTVGGKFSKEINAMLGTTICFTMSGGSPAPNVIPQEAFVLANLRLAPWNTVDDVTKTLSKVAKKFKCELEIVEETAHNASPVADTDSEQYAYLKDCINESFPDTCIVPYILTGGTDCRVMQQICTNSFRFSPIMFDKQQIGSMHASNENVNIKSLIGGIDFYKYFIRNYK